LVIMWIEYLQKTWTALQTAMCLGKFPDN
jgi:hypothetical protein